MQIQTNQSINVETNKKRKEKPVSVSEEENDKAREDKMATKRKMKGMVPMLTNIWATDKEVQ